MQTQISINIHKNKIDLIFFFFCIHCKIKILVHLSFIFIETLIKHINGTRNTLL